MSRENNEFHVVAKEDTSGKSLELVSDQLLIAAGRIPNSDTLDRDGIHHIIFGYNFVPIGRDVIETIDTSKQLSKFAS